MIRDGVQGANLYREANQQVKKGMRKAKGAWIEEQCQGTKENLQKNNSKKAYQLVKEMTSSKQGRTTVLPSRTKQGNVSEKQEILRRWTFVC